MVKKKEKATLSFKVKYNDDYYDDVSLKFTIDPDMSIYRLHALCKSFAATLGYADQSIEKAFGETVYED